MLSGILTLSDAFLWCLFCTDLVFYALACPQGAFYALHLGTVLHRSKENKHTPSSFLSFRLGKKYIQEIRCSQNHSVLHF